VAARGLQSMPWQPSGVVPKLVTCFSSALMGSGGRTAPCQQQQQQQLGPLQRCLDWAFAALPRAGGRRGILAVRAPGNSKVQEKSCDSGASESGTSGCCASQPEDPPCCGGPCSSSACSATAAAAADSSGCCPSGSAAAACGAECSGQAGCGGARIGAGLQQGQPTVEGPCHATEPRQIKACQELLDTRNRLARERKDLALRCEVTPVS
jgi:hypothetical protein